jgi:plastocyanin
VNVHRSRYAGIASIAAVLGLLVCGLGAASAAPKPTTHTVTIDGTRFKPADLTVAVGDSVVWINTDPFPHTVTSDRGGFDSKEFGSQRSWTFTAAKRGDFPYVCTLHRTMKGILRVK